MIDIYSTKSPYIGEKIKLRPLEKDDLKSIMKYWNTYESRIGLGLLIPMSSMMEAEFIEMVHNKAKNGTGYIFAIEDVVSGDFLGTCGIDDINNISRSAELGIAIHNPDNHGKGYGTDTMRCLLKFCFNILNLHRVELWVMEYNERAIHVYEKVGFKEVGRKRDAHFLQGMYHDVIVMDILEEEFQQTHPR